MEAQFIISLGQAHYRKGDKAYGEDLMNKAVEIAPTEKLKILMRAIRDTTTKPVLTDQVSIFDRHMGYPAFRHMPLNTEGMDSALVLSENALNISTLDSPSR